jgi:hypothetical protein
MALFAACRPPGPNPESKPSAVDTGEPAAPADWRLIAEHPRAALMGVTGSGEDDVWAVGADDGEGGLVLNWDGAAWARVPNADRHDLWWSHAFSPDEVFAVGAGGTVLRGGRSGFTRMSTPGLGAQTLYGAWGAAPDDLWAVGGFAGRWGFLWHFDGEAWVEQPLPDDLPLSPEGELPALFKVWGRAADDVWAVGSHGTVLHFDGAAWEVVPSGTDELLFTVHARNGRLAVVGPRTVLVEEGGAFTNVSPEGAGILQGVCVEDDGSIVISGQSGTMWVRDPAGAWAQQTNTTGVSPESLHAVWTAPSGDRWAAGGAVLSAALDQGVIVHQGAAIPSWTAPEPVDPGPAVCPDEAIDPEPGGSVARGWSEQILQAIRGSTPATYTTCRWRCGTPGPSTTRWPTRCSATRACSSPTRSSAKRPAPPRSRWRPTGCSRTATPGSGRSAPTSPPPASTRTSSTSASIPPTTAPPATTRSPSATASGRP